MGRLDVRIRHGGGPSIDPTTLLVIAGVVVLASGGGAVVTGVVSTIVSLLMVVFWTLVAIVVVAIVLGIVFRKRIGRNLRPTKVVWASRTDLPPAKPRAEPLPPRESGPREVHYHIHVPPGVYPGTPGWDRLLSADIIEAKAVDPGHE